MLVLNDAAVKLVVNTKGKTGEISPALKTLIRCMDSGETGDDYTDKLNREVTSIRTDEKWRHDFMTLAQKMTEQKYMGDHERVVRMVRKNSNRFTLQELSDVFDIPEDDCREIIALLNAHPDWTDDEVADHVMWEEWR